MEHAIALATTRVLDGEVGQVPAPDRVLTPCLVDREEHGEPQRKDRHPATHGAPAVRPATSS
jgi:hypothetical protein